jgi:hypothetical protein
MNDGYAVRKISEVIQFLYDRANYNQLFVSHVTF